MNRYKNRLRDLREDKDLTQNEIANIFKLHLTQYRRYEIGEVDLPTEWAKKFAKYYDVSIDYIANLIATPRPLFEDQTITREWLTEKEKKLLTAYKGNPQLQAAIDKLLDLEK